MSIDTDQLEILAIKLPASKKKDFTEILKNRGTNPSVFLREAIYEFLEKPENKALMLRLKANQEP